MTAQRPGTEDPPVPVFVGVGASRDAPLDEVLGLIAACLAEAGRPPAAVAALATVDVKADEPALREAAERYGVPLWTYPAAVLATVAVPHPTRAALAAVGTPSVAEAAALLAAGPAARLVVDKRKSAPPAGPPAATCALALPGPATAPRPATPVAHVPHPTPPDPTPPDGAPSRPEPPDHRAPGHPAWGRARPHAPTDRPPPDGTAPGHPAPDGRWAPVGRPGREGRTDQR
ncbi:cobalamin biosynthesis protein [Streptomyces sp. NPDC057702]|uniref:cobalamin biosynthesis protein n=1 Tax=unclassified Streptomyces TaxID=2593676 RepID=UPI0036BB7ABC